MPVERRSILFTVLFLFPALFVAPASADDAPERVLVVYNADFPDEDQDGTGDSEEVALYYAAKRKVPQDHLLALHCTSETTYIYQPGWEDFFNELVIPIRNKLIALGEEQIYYIVTCYGVPTTFRKKSGYQDRAVDNLLDNIWDLGTAQNKNLPYMWWAHPYTEFSPGIPPDLSHFDHTYKFKGKNIYLTERLSGASADNAKDLVDQALYAEKYLHPAPGHYQGILYIDTQYKAYSDPELMGYPFGYGSYEAADKSIAYSKFWADASGYAWKWENTSNGLEIGDPGAFYHDGLPADWAPEALLYAGWYNHTKYNDVWNWLPGSAACDLNSLSILGIREKVPAQFIPNAFLKGLTCGVGVIYEPTLGGHFRPEVFFYHLLHGFNFAESAALSNPGLCFVGMAVGDPLYNPHAEGKVPVLDDVPPPVPTLSCSPYTFGEVEVHAAIDTFGREPDVVVAGLEYGKTPAYGSSVPFGQVYRMSHSLAMTGLDASTLYHFRAKVRDPAGLVTDTPDYVLYTRNPDPLFLGVTLDPAMVSPNEAFTLDLLASSEGGAGRIASAWVTLTAAHLGIIDLDVTAALGAFPASIETGPKMELVLIHSQWPGFKEAGEYIFTFRAQHETGALAVSSGMLRVR